MSKIPDVSKLEKVQQVLMNVNKNHPEPLKVLGKILNNLSMPNKKDLKNLFDFVRKALKINRDNVEDEDLLRIISRIISVVDGIASLRTDASSAHGAGERQYNLKLHHARLAIHSAHTIGLYILESWNKGKINS